MNKTNHVTILLVASTLAMVGLVLFQYKWIAHSRKLSEEIFNQRASMALCSTIEEYGGGVQCSSPDASLVPGIEQASSDNEKNVTCSPALLESHSFQTDLRKTLDFYNIDLNY